MFVWQTKYTDLIDNMDCLINPMVHARRCMVIKHQMSKNMPNTDDHASLHHSHSVRFACTLMSLVILRLQVFYQGLQL